MGAYVYAVDGHVNVDIFHGRLSPRKKAVVDLITAPFFFFFVFIMFWFGGKFALNAWGFKETLSSAWGPPIYPVKTVIPVAAGLLLLQGLARFIRNLHLAVTGKEGAL
jgi:TRAP-type mannitol/chloroaromatic compound transport system permease small subunit